MSRNQFRLLVVINQLLIFGAVVVQEITDNSLPPELKNYLGIDESVLNTQITSVTPLSDVPYWFGTVLLFVGAIASVGLFFGKGWGRKLFLLNWVAMLMLTLATQVYINTGWTAFVSYLAGTTDGMILALIYFSHVKRMLENANDV
ncbi:MAG TPA: hypothetical protein VJR02_07895 [Pyrinomonadaceae bacterium]|nr:hypothetical protein [Pyrinomonadaceae bacterium]